MPTREELIKTADIHKIAEEGTKIYEEIKAGFEPSKRGQFLAIDIATKDVYLGHSSLEAVDEAKKYHPNTVFFVVRIGYSAAEALAEISLYDYQPH